MEVRLEAERAAWDEARRAEAEGQLKPISLRDASAHELRDAAQWMEDEPGLGWEALLRRARERYYVNQDIHYCSKAAPIVW